MTIPKLGSHISQLLAFKTTCFKNSCSSLGIQVLHAVFVLLIPSVELVIKNLLPNKSLGWKLNFKQKDKMESKGVEIQTQINPSRKKESSSTMPYRLTAVEFLFWGVRIYYKGVPLPRIPVTVVPQKSGHMLSPNTNDRISVVSGYPGWPDPEGLSNNQQY